MSLFSKLGTLCTVALALGVSMLSTKDAEAARGRPYLNSPRSTFVADNGELLRGPLISTEGGGVPTLAQLQALKNYGCNALHV